MLVWFMALMGIAASFLVKYIKRTSKQREWSFDFWLKDNWAETVVSVLFMVMLVIIFQSTAFNETAILDNLPWISSIPTDLIAASLAGYLNNVIWYALVKQAKSK